MLNFLSLVLRFVDNPAVQAAFVALLNWLRDLEPEARAAFLQTFEAEGGYGCSDDPECPQYPDECEDAVAAILAELK